ncbi:MAG TPA: formate dehydrogenase accessory sulfurtransferase FdhD [Halanaerobiales bacterium]|nr:formate dehydrogenase accessory sulfurtransferase FdhD [Halanaerobiales bacterium]
MMEDKHTQKYQITKVRKNEQKKVEDFIIKEQPLTIFVNGYELVTLMTLPDKIKELTVGFLISEGILKDITEIKDLQLSHQNTIIRLKLDKEIEISLFKKRTLTSGCGKGVTFSNLKDCGAQAIDKNNFSVLSQSINSLMTEMQKKAELFDRTGGTHTAALSDGNKLLYVIEDIGRHNTIDKIIGKAYLEDIDLKNKVILTSGRVSSEIIIKAVKQQIPILISRSAPTSAAVEIAREKDITLVGFTRGARYNIYNDLNRIKY